MGNPFFYAAISILGIFSVITMHLAGFMFKIPADLWPFIDISFMSSFTSRFMVSVAFALLVGRLAPYLLEYILSWTEGNLVVIFLLFKPKWRRLFRLHGHSDPPKLKKLMAVHVENYPQTQEFVESLLHLLGRDGAKIYGGANYHSGRFSGRSLYYVEKYAVLIEIFFALLVFSILYSDVVGFFLILCASSILFWSLPPKVLDVYTEKEYAESGVSLLDLLKYKPTWFVSMKKAVTIILVTSFLSGYLHHESVSSLMGRISASPDGKIVSVLGATSIGFIVVSEYGEYFFVGYDNLDFIR